jgi:20S proteasome subunit beta 3
MIMMKKLFLLFLALFVLSSSLCHAQRSDPSQFNGGSILAMAGRNSVAIAIDSRFGLGMQTISTGDRTAGSHGNASNDDDGDPTNKNAPSSDLGVSENSRILQLPDSNTLMAWTGLHGDGMSFAEELNWMLGRKVRKAGCMGFPGIALNRKKMSPRAITMLISHLLYRRRNAPYYVEPVIVGLERVRVPVISEETINKGGGCLGDDSYKSSKESLSILSRDFADQKLCRLQKGKNSAYRIIQKPYLCGTDMLGAKSTSTTFICSGVASRSLHGTAEALWKPNLDGEELVEICGKAFVSALERDILSGYGAVVYLIQGMRGEDGTGGEDDVQIIEYVLACRND